MLIDFLFLPTQALEEREGHLHHAAGDLDCQCFIRHRHRHHVEAAAVAEFDLPFAEAGLLRRGFGVGREDQRFNRR